MSDTEKPKLALPPAKLIGLLEKHDILRLHVEGTLYKGLKRKRIIEVGHPVKFINDTYSRYVRSCFDDEPDLDRSIVAMVTRMYRHDNYEGLQIVKVVSHDESTVLWEIASEALAIEDGPPSPSHRLLTQEPSDWNLDESQGVDYYQHIRDSTERARALWAAYGHAARPRALRGPLVTVRHTNGRVQTFGTNEIRAIHLGGVQLYPVAPTVNEKEGTQNHDHTEKEDPDQTSFTFENPPSSLQRLSEDLEQSSRRIVFETEIETASEQELRRSERRAPRIDFQIQLANNSPFSQRYGIFQGGSPQIQNLADQTIPHPGCSREGCPRFNARAGTRCGWCH